MGEVPTNLGKCDSTIKELFNDFQAMMKPMLYFINMGGQTFGSSAVSVSGSFGKS